MEVTFHRRFTKQRDRLSRIQQAQLKDRIKRFRLNPSTRVLRDHALTGKYRGYRSINVTGDIRAVYKLLDKELALFTHIGTHSQLYR